MDLPFSAAIEYVACTVMMVTAIGFALAAIVLVREVAPPPSDDERADLAVW